MTTFYSRANWGAQPARPGPGELDPAHVEGVVLHWPATTTPLRGFERVSSALRGWQRLHMQDRGWSDIAYQIAVDQDGNLYGLRGMTNQSAANGDTETNGRYGAVLLILAEGEQPSEAMVDSVRTLVTEYRRMYPNCRRILGHADVRDTECPGAAVRTLIAGGVFEPRRVVTPTRGRHIDAAIRHLKKATGHPARRRRIQKALRVLLKIDPIDKGAQK